jgi:formylglycine-generating enzyme required for sulfatase activity
MLGDMKVGKKYRYCPNVFVCILIIALCLIVAESQVMIVPSTSPSPRPTPKTKPKIRTKTSSRVAVFPTPRPVPTQVFNKNTGTNAGREAGQQPVTASTPSPKAEQLAFVVIAPRLQAEKKPEAALESATEAKADATSETKPDAKPEPGPATTPETKPEATAATKTVKKAEEASETNNEVKPETKSATKSSNLPPTPAAPINLAAFGYDVLTADERAKVLDRRRESSRYYLEQLSGGLALEMVGIPGGAFLMGSVETELEGIKKSYIRGIDREIKESLLRRVNSETPQHLVKVAPFYMSKYEITQAQWRVVAGLPKVNRELMSDPSQFKGGNRPVEKVSWEDAMEYCERLTRATGRKYRLPSEAEWEYAARAGTSSQFHFGEGISTEWVNYNGKFSFGASPKGEFKQQTLPVGSLALANAFGLFDMHGNVWEWCQDTWHDNYESAPEDGKAWVKGEIQYLKAIRGGAWDSSGGESRSTSRNKMTSTIRLNNIGFRVVAEVSDQLAK